MARLPWSVGDACDVRCSLYEGGDEVWRPGKIIAKGKIHTDRGEVDYVLVERSHRHTGPHGSRTLIYAYEFAEYLRKPHS